MKKNNNDEDMFLSFLIKEKELAYIEKIHAQESVKYIAKCFEEEQKKLSFLKKVFNLIRDFFMRYVMRFIQYNNKKKIKNLTEEDKKDKIIQSKTYKQSAFKIHYYLIRKFQKRTLVDDSCCVDISNFEYNVYLRIEYNDLITKPQFKNQFKNEKEAYAYYEKLLLENKNKKVKELFNEITTNIDNHYSELQSRIRNLRLELCK